MGMWIKCSTESLHDIHFCIIIILYLHKKLIWYNGDIYTAEQNPMINLYLY